MNTDTFKAKLQQDGYNEVELKELPAGKSVGEHTHPFDVRAMVLGGELTLGCAADTKTYRTGDIFELAANVPHTEKYGESEPYKFLVGKRYPGS